MIDVEVRFHGPFRISQGTAATGVDAIAHRDRIPASSLKGVMRAMGSRRLQLPDEVTDRIFGTIHSGSPWAWCDLVLRSPEVRTRVRIPIDEQSGSAVRRGLFAAEEVWVDTPQDFAITYEGPAGELHGDDALLLAACAMAVESLGAARRRGLGWVSMAARINGQQVSPERAAQAVHQARTQGLGESS